MIDLDKTTIFQVGDVVRQESDDGSMGTAVIVAIAVGHAWCLYKQNDCHRVYRITQLEHITNP